MRYLVVLTTTSTEQQAAALARSLLEAHLAACVHLQPVRSLYRWQGGIMDEPEWRLVIKTAASRFGELEAYIRSHHEYQTPEIISLAIEDGSADYLAWLADSLQHKTRAAK